MERASAPSLRITGFSEFESDEVPEHVMHPDEAPGYGLDGVLNGAGSSDASSVSKQANMEKAPTDMYFFKFVFIWTKQPYSCVLICRNCAGGITVRAICT